MKTFLAVLAAALAVLFSGCASSGTKIDPAAVQRIEKGKTTKAKLLAMFGAPLSASLLGDGREVLVWSYAHARVKAATVIPVVGIFAGGADTDTQTLQVILDERKVVQDFTSNTGRIETRTGG